MSSSDLTEALSGFFSATWPDDAEVTEPDEGLPVPAWRALSDLGLHLVGVDEAAGGSGGQLADIVAVAFLSGRHAADLPVVEANVAAWCLAEAGLSIDPAASYSIPVGETTLSIAEDDTVSGVLLDVPWGGSVDRIVALVDDGRTVELRSSDAGVQPGRDLAGQPRDALTFEAATPITIGAGTTPEGRDLRALTLRIAQTAGALRGIADLTRRYAGERIQFGKPIGSFQAVQAHLVALEQQAVTAGALSARLALGESLPAFDVLAAKIVVDEAAVDAARAAHQAHGAIGMTREYRLQSLTRRLHTWRGDFADELTVSARLGAAAASAPSFAGIILDDHQRPEILL